MKIIHIILVFTVFMTFSCNGGSSPVVKSSDKYSSMKCIPASKKGLLRPMKKSERKTSCMIKIKGMVEVNSAGDVYIVENWTSRSRKSYLVTGSLVQNIAAYNGKVISVKCCLLKKRTWSGIIRVFEILK